MKSSWSDVLRRMGPIKNSNHGQKRGGEHNHDEKLENGQYEHFEILYNP